jgi:hypothetical protein
MGLSLRRERAKKRKGAADCASQPFIVSFKKSYPVLDIAFVCRLTPPWYESVRFSKKKSSCLLPSLLLSKL